MIGRQKNQNNMSATENNTVYAFSKHFIPKIKEGHVRGLQIYC